MAARLTKADFELVIDSINEAVETFMKWYDKPHAITARAVEREVRRHLGKSFASRLKYTNDSFDGRRFEISVTKEIR